MFHSISIKPIKFNQILIHWKKAFNSLIFFLKKARHLSSLQLNCLKVMAGKLSRSFNQVFQAEIDSLLFPFKVTQTTERYLTEINCSI